ITLNQGSTTVGAGQTAQFSATVTGSGNTGVVWTLNPAVGTVSTFGMYTAPSLISTQQTVTVTATASADSTKKASAVVTLSPITVTLNQVSTTLSGGQTTQFTAAVIGTTNTAVTWKLNPAIGTLSLAGLYTAPGTETSQQTV